MHGVDCGMRAVKDIRSLLIPLCVLGSSSLGCSERARQARQGSDSWFRRTVVSAMPDERPRMLNDELPFRYPVSEYLARVQGQVLLRLFVDTSGQVVSDSTRVVEGSGHSALDSAALAGAGRLRFHPARRRGTPVPVSLLYPVHFRLPDGTPPPGDSP